MKGIREWVSWFGRLLLGPAILLGVIAVAFGAWILLICLTVRWYETDDIAKYAQVTHNNDNDEPEAFLHGFFPEKIEPYFENVKYGYKALNECSYNCEMILEFSIADENQFRDYVARLTQGMTKDVFAYDESYCDYLVSNDLYVEPAHEVEGDGNGENYFLRMGAKMGRILVNEQENKIICVGLIASACCGGYTDDYTFYTLFDINPLEYSDRFCESSLLHS